LMVFCDGTDKIPETQIAKLIRKHFDMRPRSIIKKLDLLKPVYRKTSCYGHFGRSGRTFTWEQTNMAKILAKEA
jgi:S-adenosylmethionine synthetase